MWALDQFKGLITEYNVFTSTVSRFDSSVLIAYDQTNGDQTTQGKADHVPVAGEKKRNMVIEPVNEFKRLLMGVAVTLFNVDRRESQRKSR